MSLPDDLAEGLAYIERVNAERAEREALIPWGDRISTFAVRRGEFEGVRWAVVPGPIRTSLNGYAQLAVDHPWRDRDFELIDADAPGGITYGPDNFGWIGFDTMHGNDYWPVEALAEVGVDPGPEGAYWYDMIEGLRGKFPGTGMYTFEWSVPLIVSFTEALASSVAAAAIVPVERELPHPGRRGHRA